MPGATIQTLASGAQVAIWRAPLRDVFPFADGKANPALWFEKYLPRDGETDIIVCGVPTRAECEAAAQRWDSSP